MSFYIVRSEFALGDKQLRLTDDDGLAQAVKEALAFSPVGRVQVEEHSGDFTGVNPNG